MSNTPSRLALRLQKRIKQEFNIDVEPIIHRTYAGYWQRKEGVSSWWMYETNRLFTVGSQDKAIDVARAKKLSISYWAGHGDGQISVENNYA